MYAIVIYYYFCNFNKSSRISFASSCNLSKTTQKIVSNNDQA